MTRVEMQLAYTLAPGWRAPFVEGLAEGRAVAAACRACGRVSFPPLRRCDCGGSGVDWRALPGAATILWRTAGADGAFALVRFDGADTAATVRLADVPEGATRGRLAVPPAAVPPAMILAPFDTTTEAGA